MNVKFPELSGTDIMKSKFYKVKVFNKTSCIFGVVEAFSKDSACYFAEEYLKGSMNITGYKFTAEILNHADKFNYSFYIPQNKLSQCYKKSIRNAINVKKLNIGDRVRVKKTGETGVVVKFVSYADTEKGRVVPYTTVMVKMDEPIRNKQFKSYAGSSLELL